MNPIHHRHHGEERFSEGRFHDGHHPHGHRFARHDRRHGDLQPDTAWSGRGGRRSSLGRFFAHGDLRLVVLHLIAEKPRHGYEIIKAIEESVGGAYSPSPGVIYPTLTLLEELGYVTVTTGTDSGKKLHTITPQGQAYLDANRTALNTLLARMAEASAAQPGEPAPQILRAMENLKFALRLRLSRGTLSQEQADAIAAVLDTAARNVEQT
ncbi:MAG TPA: PadR family transcriptional regulator [Rhodopila sp.]|nr:PadR family transcriptional regulator [Rhodopila sp.]